MRSEASQGLRVAIVCLSCALGLTAQASAQTHGQSAPEPHAFQQQAARDSGQSPVPIAQVRRNLNAVLAERDFKRVQEDSGLLQRAMRAFLEWIIARLSRVAAFGGRNPWIIRVLEWGGILVPGLLLVWWITARLRRERSVVAPRPEREQWAPSAREWQLWLQEADAFAQQGRWREAVHHAYWAAISRLEANGLWAVDRARTPREYLALLRRENSLRPDLMRLTRSFERIWYGNSPAGEEEYKEVRVWTDKLTLR
jgi:hypothetical protein